MTNLEWKILDFLNYDNDDKLNLEVSLLKWLTKEDFQDIIKIPFIDGKTPQDFVNYLSTWSNVSEKYWKKSIFRWSEQIALAQLYSNIFLWTNLKVDWKLWPISISEINKALTNNKSTKPNEKLSNNKLKPAWEKLVIKDWTKLNEMNLSWEKVNLKINSSKTKQALINDLRESNFSHENMSNEVSNIHFGTIVLTQSNWKYLYNWKEVVLNKWDIVNIVDLNSSNNEEILSSNNGEGQNSTKDIIEWKEKRIDDKDYYSSEFEEKRTAESVSSIMGIWLFNNWKESSRAEELNKLSSNLKSNLWTILKSSNLISIWNELKQAAPKDWIFKMWNHNQILEILNKYWYKVNSLFSVDEVTTIYSTIIDYCETQSSIPTLNDKQKLQLLLDFNKDWKLSKEINNVVWELQSYFIVNESLSSEWIDIFMKNLWFWSMNDFSIEMSNNLYLSREKFQRVLWTMVEMKIKPTELVKINWVNNALEDIYKNEKNISTQISGYLDEDTLLKSKLHTLRDVADLDEINRVIKLEAIGAYVWSNHWVWASFDIKKFVKWFVDSIQVWIINWNLWVSFTKKILEKNWFKVGVWLANFYIPLVWVSYTYHNPELKQLFSTKLEWNYKPSVYAWLSTVWQTLWLSIERAWIEDNIKAMKSSLEIIKNDLKSSHSFKNSEFAKISVDLENDEPIYSELQRFYEVNWKWKEIEEVLLDSMLKSYLHYYENLLYSNEIGWRKWKLNLTSFWWWVALVGWFMPIPYITIWWEYLSQKFRKTHLRYESERNNTHTILDKEKVWLKIVDNYNWNKVFSIPSSFQSQDLNFQWEYKFSSPNWLLQAELYNWKFYFSWKEIQSISIDENIVSDKVERTIVINWWELDENWLFVKSNLTSIKESLPTSFSSTRREGFAKHDNNIDTLNIDNIEKTKVIREGIFNLVSKETINNQNANQIIWLQKMIFDYSTWKRNDLDNIWQAFHKFIFVSDFKKYVDSMWQNDTFNNLKNKLRESTFNEEQKILILQTIPACLMKRSNLVVKWWEVKIGKTISEYDNRWKFFDWLFEKSLPWLNNSLKSARKEWFEKNWDKSTYKFNTVSDWSIAYVWTETLLANWKKNVSWLMQYSNIYNVVDAWHPFVEMPVKSIEVVNNLPSQYLQNLMKLLNSNYWLKIESISELKKFINNWWDISKGIRFDYKLAYCKMWECLNDAIIIKDMKLIKTSWDSFDRVDEVPLYSTATSEVYSAVNNRLVWGVWVTWSKKDNDKDKWDKDKPKDDNPRTDPDIANERPDIQPWNNIDQ